MTRVLLVADTHLGCTQSGRLISRLADHLPRADVILHAGDITDISVLTALADFAPVHAVLGNNDFGVQLPIRRQILIDDCHIAMVHDSGDAGGRRARLRRWFPTADVVVFGHSHIPWNDTDWRPVGTGARVHVQHHINPGSAIQARRQPYCTVAWLTLDHGVVQGVEHVNVSD